MRSFACLALSLVKNVYAVPVLFELQQGFTKKNTIDFCSCNIFEELDNHQLNSFVD